MHLYHLVDDLRKTGNSGFIMTVSQLEIDDAVYKVLATGAFKMRRTHWGTFAFRCGGLAHYFLDEVDFELRTVENQPLPNNLTESLLRPPYFHVVHVEGVHEGKTAKATLSQAIVHASADNRYLQCHVEQHSAREEILRIALET